jgi:hypothetical protein
VSFSPARSLLATLAAALVAVGVTGCGEGESRSAGTPPRAVPTEFPSPGGRRLAELWHGVGSDLELAPGTRALEPGLNRFGFALFDRARRPIGGASTALYVSDGRSGKVEGPFPTRAESLAVPPAFQSRTVASDPDAAVSLYVAELPLERPGRHQVMAVAKLDDRLVATKPIPVDVLRDTPVPEVGERAPRVSTPTVASTAGAIDLLETRVPPDSMHEVDLAEVLGRRPVVLVFATPALCSSRVCGPVVDVAEQVKADHGDEAAFIHMEIYERNRVEAGLRPQVKAWRLPTEPWAFVIDRRGRIAARLEGAFSARELDEALARATKS